MEHWYSNGVLVVESTTSIRSVYETEFPRAIGKVANRELALNGYTRFDQLTGVTTKELLAIHGVGPKSIRVLAEELAARGLAFAES